MLRTLRKNPELPETWHLASVDPANPYGAILRWPATENNAALARTVGTSVVLVDGKLVAYLRRNSDAITVFLPDSEPEQSSTARALAKKLAEVAIARQRFKAGLLVGEINGVPAAEHFLARFLQEAGFVKTALGYQMRRVGGPITAKELASQSEEEPEELEDDSVETPENSSPGDRRRA